MPNIDRTKLRELDKTATPGPWTLIHVQNVTTGKSDIAISDRDVPVGEKPTRLICSITPVELQDEADWINAAFIVEARNSVIPLLDALEAAEQRVKNLEKALKGATLFCNRDGSPCDGPRFRELILEARKTLEKEL